MASKIDSFSETTYSRKRKYPYEQWFDGSVWLLKRGEDFDCEPANLRQTLNTAAYRMGLSFTGRAIGDSLEIQALPLDGVVR